MESNHQSPKGITKDIHENGKGLAGIIKTPYWNLMLDRWVLRIEKILARHKSFLPQEVVRCEVWIGGLLKKHNHRQRSPHREM